MPSLNGLKRLRGLRGLKPRLIGLKLVLKASLGLKNIKLSLKSSLKSLNQGLGILSQESLTRLQDL